MKTTTDKIYHKLSLEILNLTLKPGTKIQEKKLQEELEIGRTPLREALVILKNDGLIKTIPQSGTYVTYIDLKNALAARFMRQAIEQKIIGKAATMPDKKLFSPAQKIIDKQFEAAKNHNMLDFFNYDNQFHRFFYTVTGNQQILDWMIPICFQLHRFRYLRVHDEHLDWEKLINGHQEILNAILHSNVYLADARIFNHLHLMLEEADQVMQDFPDYFENK
ncbi:MAG TPA: GntR family transcriptional regulator [Candidatus Ligilactobacillus excrementigallinarum]|uniref:GntR family transcriptional regulator n=1 Tax=Candidatus Ligilactobacillus excrementigallinarum TaxID=2838641 RepID=A0A9D2AA15_9LACO|nr:GntR family transcriptional regulator [Candidatus Ligilactobacillus excrementigallinarum]